MMADESVISLIACADIVLPTAKSYVVKLKGTNLCRGPIICKPLPSAPLLSVLSVVCRSSHSPYSLVIASCPPTASLVSLA